jgi:hypothetical protein
MWKQDGFSCLVQQKDHDRILQKIGEDGHGHGHEFSSYKWFWPIG